MKKADDGNIGKRKKRTMQAVQRGMLTADRVGDAGG